MPFATPTRFAENATHGSLAFQFGCALRPLGRVDSVSLVITPASYGKGNPPTEAGAERRKPLRIRVGSAIRHLAHASGISRRLAERERRVRVFMLHDVGGPQYPASVFQRQMEYVSKNCHPISIDSALAVARNERTRFDRPPVAFTFDDGLRSFATVAQPIMHWLGIPSTVFVCAGLVEGGDWIWNVEARERLRWLEETEGRLHLPELDAPSGEPESIVLWMKSLPMEARERAEALLRSRTRDFRREEASHLGHDPMSWEEMRALPADEVIVGSHTMTHPILPTLDEADQRWELAESRRVLEEKLDRPVLHFAYPNGAGDEVTLAIVKEIYVSSWGVERGFITPGDDPYRLRRFPMPHSVEGLSWTLHRP